jgi:hypothetical protein
MKRIVLTVASSSMLALAMPGIAAAANHHAHHNARHASAHARHTHAKHASVITLGKLAAPTAPAVVTPAPPTPKTSAPTVTPTACTPEQIGTVVSFENETLTIELCDKSTYTGEVTEGTEIKCRTEGKSEEGKVHNDEDSYLTEGEGGEEDDCSTTLEKGAKIYGAELNFTSFGPIWEKIGLLS